MSAIDEIAAERKRQIEQKGWTPEHDDKLHCDGKLAWAAAAYAIGQQAVMGQCPVGHSAHAQVWPWHPFEFNHRGDCRRSLVKAGALIIAEIERLDRRMTTGEGQK